MGILRFNRLINRQHSRRLSIFVLILILPLFFNLNGILYAGPVADGLSALIVFFFIKAEMKKINLWIEKAKGKHEITIQNSNLTNE